MTIERHNDNFYSEQVELNDDIKADVIVYMCKGFYTPISSYIERLEEHLAAIKQVDANHPDVDDIRVSFDAPRYKLKLTGTQPWSQEKIDEFEAASKNEKTEIDQLRLLIAKHPGKAAAALGYMLETQKSEQTKEPLPEKPGELTACQALVKAAIETRGYL